VASGSKPGAIIIDDSRAGFVFIGYDSVSPRNVSVVNNTVMSSNGVEDGAILFRPSYSGYGNIRIQNNIFGQSENAITSWGRESLPHVTSEYNNFFAVRSAANVGYSGYSLSNWRSEFGKDTLGSLSVDPRFESATDGDYRLAPDSPLRAAGRDILDLDRDGLTTDSIAIGAYALGNEVIGLGNAAGSRERPNPPVGVSVD